MEGVASEYALARAHEILLQTTRFPGIATDRLRQKRRSKPAQATQSHHKATTRPPQGHILSIDSGVQRHLKATPRLPQGYPKATPRLPQGSTKAPPRPPQPGPKPKSEIRDPKEIRKPKAERSFSRWAGGLLARFRVRISDFGLPSVFGFRSSGFRPGSRFQPSTHRAPKQPAKSPQSYPKA